MARSNVVDAGGSGLGCQSGVGSVSVCFGVTQLCRVCAHAFWLDPSMCDGVTHASVVATFRSDMSAILAFAELVVAHCRSRQGVLASYGITHSLRGPGLSVHKLHTANTSLCRPLSRWSSTQAGLSLLLVHPRDRSSQDLEVRDTANSVFH